MDQTTTFGLGLAFTAGLLSFLSPCVLPLIPSYVTFITGMSVDEVQRSRRTALTHALLFILGFTLIFLALGATASALGRVLLAARDWVARAGGDDEPERLSGDAFRIAVSDRPWATAD